MGGPLEKTESKAELGNSIYTPKKEMYVKCKNKNGANGGRISGMLYRPDVGSNFSMTQQLQIPDKKPPQPELGGAHVACPETVDRGTSLRLQSC